MTVILEWASRMLGVPVEDLDDDLVVRLKNINELCKMVGHDLRSAQLVAAVVDAWQRDQRTK